MSVVYQDGKQFLRPSGSQNHEYEGLIMTKLTVNFQEIMSTSALQKWAVTVWWEHDVRKMFDYLQEIMTC